MIHALKMLVSAADHREHDRGDHCMEQTLFCCCVREQQEEREVSAKLCSPLLWVTLCMLVLMVERKYCI